MSVRRLILCLCVLLCDVVFSKDIDPAINIGLGYNNPISSDIGLNLMARTKHFGVEGGLGWGKNGIDDDMLFREDTEVGSILDMEVDAKIFLGPQHLEIYMEGGIAVGYIFVNKLVPAYYYSGFLGAGITISSQGHGKGFNIYGGAKYILDETIDRDDKWLAEAGLSYGFHK